METLSIRVPFEMEIAIKSFCDGTDMDPSGFIRTGMRHVLQGLTDGSLVILNGKVQPSGK